MRAIDRKYSGPNCRVKDDRQRRESRWLMQFFAVVVWLSSPSVWAHDPIFGIGPHVLFKGGFEVAPTTHIAKAGAEQETETGLEVVYGLTGDLALDIELPYK